MSRSRIDEVETPIGTLRVGNKVKFGYGFHPPVETDVNHYYTIYSIWKTGSTFSLGLNKKAENDYGHSYSYSGHVLNSITEIKQGEITDWKAELED